MMRIKAFSRALLLLALAVSIAATAYGGCFSVVVGKKASVEGCVIMAHNEDDTAPQIVNHRKIPRKRHAPGASVQLRNGGTLDQVEQTWAYIWSEMPGMLFSDSYINEWGVGVTSDNCPSREDGPEITDGGIGYMLRRLVAERARTAREGVLLAGKLVERFGYVDSGRTYVICDAEEGWLLCVISGKRWLAKRVADDEVAMVANTYTIRQVDLSDTSRFLGSKDIVEYAKSRRWYNPQVDGEFDFARAYANRASASHPSNLGRQADGLRYICSQPIRADRRLPFSVKPRRRISVADAMQILRHDRQPGEGLPSAADASGIGCPICSGATQTSFVAQLRKGMPSDIGIVYWVCLASPRISFYIPFHFGIPDFPEGFCSEAQRPSEEFYNARVASPFKAEPLQAFWTFSNFYHTLDVAPAGATAEVKAQAVAIEKNAFALQRPVEEAASVWYKKDARRASRMLANYSDGIYLSCLEAMGEIAGGLADERR